MVKFIIGVDAFSDPESSDEKEYITHTEYPRFIAEIFFVESKDKQGFKLDSINLLWSEVCEKNVLSAAMGEAEKAILFYTKKSMEMEI